MNRLAVLAGFIIFGFVLVLPAQWVGAWTPDECEQAPSPKPPDCQETTTTIPETTTVAPTTTTTVMPSVTTTVTSVPSSTVENTHATVAPYGGGDVGTATETGTPAELPNTGFTTFLLCVGIAFLIGGCLAIPFMRRERKEDW